MDFSKVLEDWENRGNRRDKEPFDKDSVVKTPRPTPSRAEIERTAADDELDLHGMLQDEAVTALRYFLRESRLEGCRKVLVIHGKGLHSQNQKGVLKDAVAQVLMKDKNVASWGEAARQEGGKGASWVWLNVLSAPGR